jgi:integrase
MGLSRGEIESRLKKPGQVVWVERGIYATRTKAGQIRYGISYQYGTKRRQKMIGPSIAQTRKELAKKRADIERGQYQEKRRVPTFYDFGAQYLEFAAENGKKTVNLDKLYVGRFKEHFGDVPIDQITSEDIQKYKQKRKRDRVPNNPTRTIAPRTTNMELKLLRRMFGLAVRHWKYLRENPALDVEMLSEPERPDRVLEPWEEARLLEELPAHIRPVFLFALHTGMRSRSEVLALTWDAVDMRRRVVSVNTSKTGKVRTIPLNDTAFGLLRKIRVKHQVGPVFIYRGKPIQRINKAFSAAIRRAGIPHITFHQATRHTFGTRLARKGIALNEIKDLMGHTSIVTTQRYLHSNETRGREAVAALD